MQTTDRCGILLVNTGTPAKPQASSVHSYLSRFLMDKRIAPMNRTLWWFILHFFILPKRAPVSAAKYKTIWTDEGSPFAIAHDKLQSALNSHYEQEGMSVVVRCAMSYSNPRIRDSLRELKQQGCTRLVVLPLYPQSAFSTTGAVSDKVTSCMAKDKWNIPLSFINDYHQDAAYAKGLAASILHAGFEVDSDDKILFSYHSIPLTDIEAGDTYELQCGASSLQIAGELGIERNSWTMAYQCRFDKGRDWLAPYTTEVLERWAETGVGRLFFVCPGFAVDCLETLYDIEYELKPFYFTKVEEKGKRASEQDFVYVPCLDRSRAHVKVLVDVLQPYVEGFNHDSTKH